MKKRIAPYIFQSLVAFCLLANGAFVEVNGSNLNSAANNALHSKYTPPVHSARNSRRPDAFGKLKEQCGDELVFKISAHELAAYVKRRLEESLVDRIPIMPWDVELFDRLFAYMEYAYSLQKDLEKEEEAYDKARYTYYMPHDITQHIVDLSITQLFDLTQLSPEYSELFRNALYEMAGNPHGAKRLISLLLLRKASSYNFIPCFKKFSPALSVLDMKTENGNSSAYFKWNPDDARKDSATGKILFDFEYYKTPSPINEAYYAKIKHDSNTFTPEENLASTILHELTHAYHYFLTGILRVPLAKVSASGQGNLFPTHDLDFFKEVSSSIYDSISSSKVDADEYIAFLNPLRMGLDAFSKQQQLRYQYLSLVKDDSYYCKQLDIAKQNKDLETLHRLAADLITEQIIAGKNYWRDSEELLTIFGAVPYLEEGKHKVIVIDRDNHVSYLARTRNKTTWFFHSHSPLWKSEERMQQNNVGAPVVEELEVPKIANLLDFLNKSLPEPAKVNEYKFIRDFTSKLKNIMNERAKKASTAEGGATSIPLHQTVVMGREESPNPKPYKALSSNVETVNSRITVSEVPYSQTKPKGVVSTPNESKYKSNEKGIAVPTSPKEIADQLRIAIVNKEQKIVENILKLKPDYVKQAVNDRAENGDTPLAVALRYNKTGIVDLLLKSGADPFLNNSTQYLIGLLCYAIESKNDVCLQQILNKNIDLKAIVNGTDSQGNTPLITAIKYKNASALEQLIQNGADKNSIPLDLPIYGEDLFDIISGEKVTNEKSWANQLRESITANINSATENILLSLHNDLPKDLFQAVLNDLDENGDTPLDFAVKNKNRQAVKLLLQYGVDAEQYLKFKKTSDDGIQNLIVGSKVWANQLRDWIKNGEDITEALDDFKKGIYFQIILDDLDENGDNLLDLAVKNKNRKAITILQQAYNNR
ncbi:MAG: hypothetical protein LBT70_05265 [Holosporaceae bacterium]|jgi:ankyrin repeat protein|nr:hypothetical protein [Holosporaceae bacterium]